MVRTLLAKMDKRELTMSLFVDAVLLAFIYLIPTLSHLLAFPMYMIDPMRFVVFISIILSKSKFNSFFLAVTIPLFSFFIGGHPIFIKSLLIGVELITNLAIFWFVLKKLNRVFISTLISIFFAKIIYYLLKALLIHFNLIQMELVSTSIYLQTIMAMCVSIIMSLFYKRKQ